MKALCLVAIGVLLAAPAAAQETLTVAAGTITTGEDFGPQDGSFDKSSVIPGIGQVVNNGYVEYRSAFAFDASVVPPGVAITAATLTFNLYNFEGDRTLSVHGYSDDGTVQLADFEREMPIGAVTIGPIGFQVVSFDVKTLIDDLITTGGLFAGFTVRELVTPANFLVMNIDRPFLRIEYILHQTTIVIDIDIAPGRTPNRLNRHVPLIAVALLSSPEFDAPAVLDRTSLTFGRLGDEHSLALCARRTWDLNGDDLPDVLCLFKTASAGFLASSNQGVITGRTIDGADIVGTDSVRIVR